MTGLRNFLLLIVVIFTLSFTIGNKVTKKFEKSNVAVGAFAPQFSFTDIEDEVINLKDLQGKYTYINFWTTWSEPSKEELTYFNGLVAKYGSKINFVNISIDYKRDIKTWKSFVTNENLKGIQLIADNDWKSDFITSFDIVKIPRAILIDEDGKIVSLNTSLPSEAEEVLNSIK